MAEHFALRATLEGHGDWVTSVACPVAVMTGDGETRAPPRFVTASRDKRLMVWEITGDAEEWAVPSRALTGHSHFVQDVVLSQDACYALSGSWDGCLRLWELKSGDCQKRFAGHERDVLSVAFNANNTKIVSGSRDKTIKLWNVLGECKSTMNGGDAHKDWVSCVRFSPKADEDLIVSCGWDKTVKVWTAVGGEASTYRLQCNLVGHTEHLNTVTISPDASLCASGGKDGKAKLWDINEGKELYELDAGGEIFSLVFSPMKYWLCAATTAGVIIWDLESKQEVARLEQDPVEGASKKALKHYAISLAWTSDGGHLIAGYTDKKVRVWVPTQG